MDTESATATETQPTADVIQPIASANPPAEPPKTETPPPAAKPTGKSLLDDLPAAFAPIDGAEPVAPKPEGKSETPAAEPPKPVDSPEAAKAPEPPKPEEKPVEGQQTQPQPGSKEFNFREVERRAKEAEATLKIEQEKFQQQLQKEKERNELLQKELRAAAIERDPEFVAKYDTARQKRIKEMATLVEAKPDEILRAIQTGQDEILDEWRSSLGSIKGAKWDAALTKVMELETERAEAVAQADQTWQQMQEERQKSRQYQSAQISQENLAIAQQITEKLYAEVPFVAQDQELRSTIEATLQEAATGKWDVEKLLRSTAFSVAQMKMLGVQSAVIKGLEGEKSDLQKQLAEAQQKLSEQEQFISSRSSATPRGESSSATQNGAAKYVSLLDRLPEAIAPLR